MKKGFVYIIAFCFAGFASVKGNAQTNNNDTIRVEAFITPEGDTIPQSWLPTVEVIAKQTALWKNYWRNWTRLKNAVYVTYPYAKTASKLINEVNSQLANVSDEGQRKKIIKSREKEMKRDFGDKVTSLSVYQGKVLMKLINRETGNNCYEIIKEYKGGFNAGFWQTVAFVFGSSLKQQYDPKGEDKDIEKIVLELQKLYGYKG
ncbi:MAG: DUF4294 domain-containing protein [Bacteroidetes bacterium]|jgi:hypothetical protein|nr:DUF4294 domain-containing protein [Bacteroidota bacterium]